MLVPSGTATGLPEAIETTVASEIVNPGGTNLQAMMALAADGVVTGLRAIENLSMATATKRGDGVPGVDLTMT